MKLYDKNQNVTIDEDAANRDIRRISQALPSLQEARASLERVREEGNKTQGETGKAIAWAGLRGASSSVFAIMAVAAGVSMKQDLFHIVFMVSLFSVAIQGTLLPKVARKLEAYGIVLRDEKGRLNADEAVTRNEFSSLMSNIGSWYYNKTGGDKPLTRQFAAKILTNRIISEECAELEGVFKSPFSDVKEDSKYVGYIAVANALGYMKGKNGKFNPGAKITRGEALVMLYNRLAV